MDGGFITVEQKKSETKEVLILFYVARIINITYDITMMQ